MGNYSCRQRGNLPVITQLAHVKPDEVEWVEADELWTYVGQKKGLRVVVGD